jgi:hypothetical protein
VAAYTGWKDSRNDPTKAVKYGTSGDLIDPADIEAMRCVLGELSVAIPWEKGDVLWIDNEQVLHSRNPFEGERRILAYLGKDEVLPIS